MMTEFARDAAVTAAIFGFFAAGWFGWAQDDPPTGWRGWLTAGSVVSMIVAIAGGVLAWLNWSSATAFDRGTAITFGIIVVIEVALSAIGAVVLTRRGWSDLVAPWIALIVGIHFFPLAPLLEFPLIYVTATAVTIGAVIAVPLARAKKAAPSAYTGLFAGAALLATALVCVAAVI